MSNHTLPLPEEIPKKLSTTFLYYLCCGGVATIFDWGSFYAIAYVIKWNYLIAVTISYTLGSVVNYTSNKYFTFNNSYSNIPVQFAVYMAGSGSALILTYIQMIAFVEYLHIDRMVSRIIITAIMLFYNFGFHKIYTFGKLK